MNGTFGSRKHPLIRTRKKFLTAICFSLACLVAAVADERIILPAKINGQPVRLAFDTEMSHTALFRSAAIKLGLEIIDPPRDQELRPGAVKFGRAACRLTLGSKTQSAEFAVLDSAIGMDCDGALAWSDFRSNIIQIAAEPRAVTFLDKLPADAAKWPNWKLRSVPAEDMSSNWLGFEIPRPDGRKAVVFVDTGSDQGLRLRRTHLKRWVEKNPGAPVTLEAYYCPGFADGLVVAEQFWAGSYELAEGIELRELPLSQSPNAEAFAEPDYEATLCLFALTRVGMIVDGIAGRVYLQPCPSPKAEYAYNRIGALFAPHDIRGGDLIARVVKGGPAYEAGVRDGDILMRIGDLDATKWQTDPRILPLSRFWSQPAGTKVNLTCLHQGTNMNLTVELKELFPGAVSPRKAASH
jgi:hypothetical protein